MRLCVILERLAWISSTETKKHPMAYILLLGVWMFHCYPLPSTSSAFIPSLSHAYCFKFFLWLQITTWSSSVSGRVVRPAGLSKKQRQQPEQCISAVSFLKSLYLTWSKLMKFLGCLIVQCLTYPARRQTLNSARELEFAFHQGCICMITHRRWLAAIMPVSTF